MEKKRSIGQAALDYYHCDSTFHMSSIDIRHLVELGREGRMGTSLAFTQLQSCTYHAVMRTGSGRENSTCASTRLLHFTVDYFTRMPSCLGVEYLLRT